jgi:hypothetical protein
MWHHIHGGGAGLFVVAMVVLVVAMLLAMGRESSN